MPLKLLIGRAGALVIVVTAFISCKPATTAQKATSGPKKQQNAETATEDIRVARNVMALSEVIAELSSGTKSAVVLEHVRERHIATLCVEGDELKFAANGANRELLAALKDQKNLLTPTQETVYMPMVAERHAQAARAKPASAKGRHSG